MELLDEPTSLPVASHMTPVLWGREGEIACLRQIWSRPLGAESLQSTARTATSGQHTDSWLPQMMHWPWHPNWPQCLSQHFSQGTWCFCMCAPVCGSACLSLSLRSVGCTTLCLYFLSLCICSSTARFWILVKIFLLRRDVAPSLLVSLNIHTPCCALGQAVLHLTFHLRNLHHTHTNTHRGQKIYYNCGQLACARAFGGTYNPYAIFIYHLLNVIIT